MPKIVDQTETCSHKWVRIPINNSKAERCSICDELREIKSGNALKLLDGTHASESEHSEK